MTDRLIPHHHRHKREPRRHKQDVTHFVREVGAEAADDMMQESPEGRKAALRRRKALDSTMRAIGGGEASDWPQEGEA